MSSKILLIRRGGNFQFVLSSRDTDAAFYPMEGWAEITGLMLPHTGLHLIFIQAKQQ